MEMKKLILKFIQLTLFTFFSLLSYSQKITISGIIKDIDNSETILGAYVILQELESKDEPKGTVSNNAGFYSLSVSPGEYSLKVSYLGYTTIADTILLTKNQKMNFEMSPLVIRANEVVVTAEKEDQNVTSVDVGRVEMKVEAIKALPVLFGEVDVIKAIQLLPGIQSGGEGNSGFYVRGGGADQNLILLDEATIYNAGHLLGFFSVFNADAIKNVEVIKSGMPAYYGERLSSVLDVKQKEGNMKKFEVDGGLGIIFSRLTVQGPIKKNKCSFILSGRRTYIDLLIQPFLKKTSPLKGTNFYFYDLNGKINLIINDKHRLFLGGYFGKDVYGFKSESGGTKTEFNWLNAIGSLRWNYIISPQLFLNTSATFSNYNFKTDILMDVYSFKLKSGVRDYSLKSELTYLPPIPHKFRMGVHYIFHTFFPNSYSVEAGNENNLSFPDATPYYAHELAIYVHDEYEANRWLVMNMGLRFSHFEHVGSFKRYIFDDFGNLQDSILYKPGERISQYSALEPRFSARFLLSKNLALKASYTLNYQYLHQISMATISLPTDVWMPSTDLIKPQIAHQVSLGLFYNFHKNVYESYVDIYYKKMYNLSEYKDGIDLTSISMNPDQLYTFGEGYSYGAEFFIKKAKGRFNGFIGYTLALTKREFENLNDGKPFYAKYDRRHDVSISLGYEIIRNKLYVSAVWVYATGNTMTIPIGFYFFGGAFVTEYSERNEFRLPPYHRLDLSLQWTIVKRKKFETGLNFSVYNVYNRKNAFFIFYESTSNLDIEHQQYELTTKAYQMSLFPILPSITWNFKF